MIIRILSILLLLTVSVGTSAQKLTADTPILLKTDRSRYISGDDALFCVFFYDGIVCDTMPGTDINIDITDIENRWITGLIVKQIDGMASGMLNLPDTLQTGYYRMRAYTNYPNIDNHFCCCEIYVTNRFDKEPRVIMRNQKSKVGRQSDNSIIVIGKSEFAAHETINLSINCPDTVSALVRIVGTRQWDGELEPVCGKGEPYRQNEGFTPITPYDGILVAGTVTDSVSGAPIDNAIVLVSLQDSIIRLKYDITDADGSFCVLLHNYYGLQQIFVSAFNQQLEPYYNARITLRNQFAFEFDKPTELIREQSEIDSLELDKALITKAFEMRQFEPAGISNRPKTLYDHFVLGSPRQTVFTDDYIALNDFREITRELTPFVRIRKGKNGEPELRVVSDKGAVSANPLLLVDGVPLTQLKFLIDKGSSMVKRVDTQNKPRNFGNINFNNGIVAVWTHKLDFWEKCSVPGTYKFIVQGFQPPLSTTVAEKSKDKLPDLRQTIYWNPLVNTSVQNSIEVTLSDETGEFVIEFFGFDRNGKIVSDFKKINVR
ncbi:MAG: carboxypeptidase regulatory-like domain-containing protein [Salinivirgaceae bacterium]|nr:carboxypeptidase regulatory-like domain-containing protein [Salinivirgaceae bacterium]